MADVKISGLPASTVPLAGTEVLPIVQGGATKQVSIANVTAGRVIAASGITTDTYKAASSAGGTLQANNGTDCLQWGAGGGSGLIFDGGVSSTAANAALVFSPTGTGTVAISPTGALTVNPTAASTINNVAIGGSTPLAGAFTTATANAFIPNSATIPTNGTYLPAANTLGFATASTERARIDASGNLLIGQTARGSQDSNSFNLDISSAQLYCNHASGTASGTGYVSFGYAAGIIGSITQTGTTGVLYNITSDYRLKNDVTPIQNALATVKALNPVSFNWIDGRPDDGFLAHELQAIIPNCVTGKKDAVNEDGTPKYQQMDNSGVIPFLVKAIQELNTKFDVYVASHP